MSFGEEVELSHGDFFVNLALKQVPMLVISLKVLYYFVVCNTSSSNSHFGTTEFDQIVVESMRKLIEYYCIRFKLLIILFFIDSFILLYI